MLGETEQCEFTHACLCCKLQVLPFLLKTSSTSCSISAYPIAGIYSSGTAMAKRDGHASFPNSEPSPLASVLTWELAFHLSKVMPDRVNRIDASTRHLSW